MDSLPSSALTASASTLAAGALSSSTATAAAATPLVVPPAAAAASSLLATAASTVATAIPLPAATAATLAATAPPSSVFTSWMPTSVLLILRSLLALPYRFLGYLSFTVTATVTFNYWSLLLIALLLVLIGYLILRYRVLTTYSRLPAPTPTRKTVGVPFDLHPDTAFHDDGDRGNYPDELMGAFLSSIKIFGYLDRPVFHELARHLRTRKLKAGEVLFRSEDDVRDFFVVVDGTVQVFVKGAEEKDGELFTEGTDSDDSTDDGSSTPVGTEWAGYHLLNEVRAGGTVSSLFNILSVFTEKTEVTPTSGATPGKLPRTPSHESNGSSSYQEVFPNLRRDDSPQGHSPPAASQDGPSPLRGSQQDMPHTGVATERQGFDFDVSSSAQNNASEQPQRPQLHRIFTADTYTRLHPNIATRAATDTTLAVIPAEAFQQLTEKFPKAAAHMVQVILTRFQRVTFMTLYRYLGLSKELLKIEKRVNEISGFGLPENLLSLADFQKLRNRANNIVRGLHDQSLSQAVLRSDKRRGHADAPATLRPRRYSKHRERWVDDSDFEDGGGRAASTAGDPPRIAKPKNPKDLKGHLLDNNQDDLELKESIFACIAQIVGIFPRDDHHMGASGMGAGSATGFGHSPLTSNSRAASTTLGGFLSRNRSYMDGQVRSSPMSSNSDFDDTASTSSRVSLASSIASDTGASDLHLMFYERGATLIKEGERNAGLYFVIDGILEASVRSNPDPYLASTHDQQLVEHSRGSKDDNPGAHRRSLFLIKPGGLAGYLAAVTGYISFVSIRAKTDVYVGFLPKNVLDRYIERHPSVLLSLAKRLISQLSPLVFHIDAALGWDQANAGQILCREGDPSDCIYIVLNGRLRSIVERAKENDDQPPAFEILSEYGQGESVGEMEVLTDGRRPATVHAIRDTEIAVMPKTFFNALALRHPEITIAISRIIAARSRQSIKRGVLGGGSGAGGGGEAPANNTWDPPRSVASAKNMVNVNMRTVAILPVNSLVPVADFARELHNAMELVGASVAVLNNGSVMNTLGKHAFSRIGRLKLMSWLADLEESHRMVIYVADGGVGSPWTQRCVRQADCVFLVGLGDEDPEIGDYERLLIGMKTTARKELVLVHSSRSCIPGSTATWLKNRVWVHAHHHVQMQLSAPRMLAEATRTNTVSNLRQHFSSYPHGAGGPAADRTLVSGGGLGSSTSSLTAKLQGLGSGINIMADPAPGHSTLHLHTGIRSDFARLARRLLSRSVGLVLGGGGARGISHIGIIRALEEAGIPVDMVGGTSIGSFVGGLYARDNDHVAVYGRAKMFAGRIVSKWRQILDLTYPVTAMFTGHEFNRSIWKCFKETQIEDCWLPYFAVTTNITHSRMEVHQTGYMWRYVRASMSLSGYLPPLCDNGNMLLDGGYLNNLPADLMRAQQGAHTIIAVDVGSVDDTSPVNYGDSLSGWWALAQRYVPILGPALTRKYGQIPLMADIQSRLTYVSSVKQLEDAKALDGVYYLNPHVQMYGTLEFDKFSEIFDVGYRYGTGMVDKWRKDGTLRARFGVREGHGDGGWGRHARRASI